jgi:FdhD protein
VSELLPVTEVAVNLPVVKYRRDQLSNTDDIVAVEEPLEIRVAWIEKGIAFNEALTVTMRTPGHDRELVAGLLWSEGIIQTLPQLARSEWGDNPNTVIAHLTAGHQLDIKKYQRYFYSTSSCGVCGKMAIESLQLLHNPLLIDNVPTVAAAIISVLPQALPSDQALFQQTGGTHAAALFDRKGQLLLLREDIGRHNAVDKLLGSCLLEQAPKPSECILLVSGRVGFELVQKALMANIAVMAAVGAPTSLAVQMAQAYNMTLIGFVKKDGFNIYSGHQRIVNSE